jgi:protein arginine kinase activator
MKCDLCENEATVFLTEIVDGKMRKINLCESCARENEVEDPTGFALADVLLGMSKNQQSGEEGEDQNVSKCPACSFTRSDFEKTGRLGCPVCYETFAEEILGMLQRLHKGVKHQGKTAANTTYPSKPPDAEQKLETTDEEAEAVGSGETVEIADDPLLDLPGNLEDNEQSGSENAGKDPAADSIEQELKAYRNDLEKAVQEEEYEKAAELRDAIKDLEKQRGEH